MDRSGDFGKEGFMKAVVTGGAGFIGYEFWRFLFQYTLQEQDRQEIGVGGVD